MFTLYIDSTVQNHLIVFKNKLVCNCKANQYLKKYCNAVEVVKNAIHRLQLRALNMQELLTIY